VHIGCLFKISESKKFTTDSQTATQQGRKIRNLRFHLICLYSSNALFFFITFCSITTVYKR